MPKASAQKRHTRADLYIGHTMPGLEQVAWREIEGKLPDVQLIEARAMGTKNGLVVFAYEGDPALLQTLRTVEDVFYVAVRATDLPAGRAEQLAALERLVAHRVDWPRAMSILGQSVGGQASARRRMTFRVISRVQSNDIVYRKETQVRVERAIQAQQPRWLLVEDESALEFWLNVFPDELLLGLRLSDKTMRQREYKIEHLPASLRPSVAAAMVSLTQPTPDDVFMDPMCGAGTLLIERALWSRYKQLLGGDARAEAVAVARANIGSKYKPIRVEQWDATDLQMIADTAVDAVACNLPFGKQIGSRRENETLYGRFLREVARVVRPGGRVVLLTSDYQMLGQKLNRMSSAFAVVEEIPLLLLGVRARIFVLVRRT